MTTLRTAAQQALEALEWHYRQGHSNTLGGLRLKIDEKALRNLKAALAQQDEPEGSVCARCGALAFDPLVPQQAEPVEPVAWRWGYRSVTTGEMDWRGYVEIAAHPNLRSPEIIMEPLYTAPPQRPPLTEEDIDKIFKHLCNTVGASCKTMARAVERAHGIKE